MIVITGAAGFIGSAFAKKLNKEGFNDLILVDDFSHEAKKINYQQKKFTQLVEREHFFEWLDKHHKFVEFIIHLGARTDTTEFDSSIFDHLNLNYSKTIWQKCVAYGLPLLYASSAATYGMGELGYEDNHEIIENLKPLNPYGESKNEFDKWALAQEKKPYFWAGFKFFNVYGANEYHKGRMASVVFHTYNQIQETGAMKLFRSHNPNFQDGKQMRDFVYVKDVVEVLYWFMHHRKNSGIYNLGSGRARSFLDLAKNTFKALGLEPQISFIDTPVDIRDKYQYFTEANIDKLRKAGYIKPFYTLEAGVLDYVQNFLAKKAIY
jgi:ADP-L-glycero-D-manno-heptose 6-epimerase